MNELTKLDRITHLRRDGRRRGRAACVACLLCCAAFFGCTITPVSAQVLNRAAELKAVYTTKFAGYTTWPDSAATQPVVIGVVGETPVGKHLAALAARYPGRLQVVTVESADEIPDCRILFVSSLLPRDVQRKVLTAVRDKPILTVGDSEHFVEDGGIIEFRIADNKLGFNISNSAASRAGLHLSARLLQLALKVF